MIASGLLYGESAISKTGVAVPLFFDGSASSSLYDPEREAAHIVDSIPASSFIVFAGIGSGLHIREFLRRNADSSCLVAEAGRASLSRLRTLVDIEDILRDPRVTVVPDCSGGEIETLLPSVYLPAIHGDFSLVPLRSWQSKNPELFHAISSGVRRALDGISADYSVQTHFGKLWFRNFFLNIAIASRAGISVPAKKKGKAVVAAAGPGLESMLPAMRDERDSFVIFSTDTAYGSLFESGIIPDFFVSIDAQSISARHAMHPFTRETTVILDLCANPDIAMRAQSCGAPILFACGNHPLARYAARSGAFPLLDTSSGTVTLAALDAAHALGYADIAVPGADFAYVGGKPYARGTYLEKSFGAASDRMRPMEGAYTALMFRTEVSQTVTGHGITYRSEILERYGSSFRSAQFVHAWKEGLLPAFDFSRFVREYRESVKRSPSVASLDDPVVRTLLPLAAWVRANPSRCGDEAGFTRVIKLALELIAGYTDVL